MCNGRRRLRPAAKLQTAAASRKATGTRSKYTCRLKDELIQETPEKPSSAWRQQQQQHNQQEIQFHNQDAYMVPAPFGR